QKQKEAGASAALLTMDEQVNWTAHEPVNEEAPDTDKLGLLARCTSDERHDQFALMGLSQVHNCIFGCSIRYNELKEEYDAMKPKFDEC
ncbi:hypothetical protein, partial [Salmonella enterica]|uniref:hypothetical protein n=1 Tax=Salmonella enterica TaxID=28901 RepID=UPI0020C309DA